MKLVSFQVQRFRNIIDSGVVEVSDPVTCLVGMNESGKTTLLSALHRLNPIDGLGFNEQLDYPRWLLTKDRRDDVVAKVHPIKGTFELDDEDAQAVEAELGPGVLKSGQVTVMRLYNEDSAQWLFSWDSKQAVKNLLERAGVRAKTAKTLAVDDLNAVEAACVSALEAADGDDEREKLSAEVEKIRQELKAVGAAKASRAVIRILAPRLPRFFYFDEYALLEGRINVKELEAEEEETGSSAAQTARALLALAGTTPAALSEDDYEDRKAELEAVSSDLTDQIFEYWKQNPHLRVIFDIDRKIEAEPNTHPRVVAIYLDIRVEDTRHRFTNNFSQRSSGFRWFFSFLAAFTEFESRNENFVVLLDEPGLTLHGRAQADFMRFINERLATAVQVVYTTHSPFMIETDRIDRIRIVEDKGPEVGAVVTQEVLSVGENSVFPLQAALGYDVAQHLFIGPANLLVEGASDFLYLDLVGRKLKDVGREGLDDQWRVLPTGGSSNIPAFVALMGQNLEVSVLVDSGTEGAQRLDAAVGAGRIGAHRVVRVGDIDGRKHADIEDVFTVPDYLTLFNKAFGTSHSEAELGHGDRIVKRLADLQGGDFDHYRPAEALLRNPDLLDGLSAESLDAFEALCARLNQTLEAQA